MCTDYEYARAALGRSVERQRKNRASQGGCGGDSGGSHSVLLSPVEEARVDT